jgi:hypothetical protein
MHIVLFAARHCCFYCLITSAELQKHPRDRPDVPVRTLDQIQEHYAVFTDRGSVKSKAKDVSFNVIGLPILNIPIHQVSFYHIKF